MSTFYILNEARVAVPVDLLTWARWFETHDTERIVARDVLPGEVVVSTVFLGVDHAWLKDGGPRQIFETMVFRPRDVEVVRYATWAQAEAGHQAMLRRLAPAAAEPIVPPFVPPTA